MYSDEFLDFFEEKCSNSKPYLSGVVAIDMIRDLKKLRKGHFLIFNASKRDSKGSHWLCLSRGLEGNYIVFDRDHSNIT